MGPDGRPTFVIHMSVGSVSHRDVWKPNSGKTMKCGSSVVFNMTVSTGGT